MTKKVIYSCLIIFMFFISACTNEIDDVLKIPVDFKPSYKLIQQKNLDYANVKRIQVKIAVSPGLSKNDLEYNLKFVAKNTYNQRKPNAISVIAYKEGTDYNSVYTAAISEFAPYGDWGRANEKVDIKNYELKIIYSDEYFGIKKKVIPKPKVEKSKLHEFVINLKLKKISRKVLEINVNTTFPEKTKLLISVSRTYFEKNDNTEYSGNIYSKDHLVLNGKIKLELSVSDSNWYNDYFDKQKKMGKDMFPGIDLNRISKSINVSVLYSPKRSQSKEILKITGENGEYLTGNQVSVGQSLNTLSLDKKIEMKFMPSL